MARVAIHIVTWNGERYVPFLFESLARQTYTDVTVRILDNASSDGTLASLERERARLPFPSEIMSLQENIGFAGGHNTLFRRTQEPYVLLVNQDMYLRPDCLERLVGAMDAFPACAAVSPRLMQWDFKKSMTDGLEAGLTPRIDSLGIERLPNRRFIEKEAGETWNGGQDVMPVFGVSGALPLCRVAALRDAAIDGNLFDPEFESYKEDVELSYRLRKRGYDAMTVTSAVAYHDRTAAMPEGGLGDWAAWRNKARQSQRVRFLSYRNHLAILFVHETWQSLGRDLLSVLWYEAKKGVVHMLLAPLDTMRAWRDVLRRYIKKSRIRDAR